MCLELPARYWNLGDGPLEAHSETILFPRLHPKTTCSSFWHRNFSSGGAAVATLQVSRAQITIKCFILVSPILQLPGKAPGTHYQDQFTCSNSLKSNPPCPI